jgi:hypothetical protein
MPRAGAGAGKSSSMLVHRRCLGLEAARDRIGVEAKGARVGPHERERVGIAGQLANAPSLQRLEILQTDAQGRRHVRQ